MKVPRKLVFLGFAYELVWADRALGQKITLFKLQTSLNVRAKNVYGLFSNSTGAAIFVLPVKGLKIQNSRQKAHRGQALFERWSDYRVDLVFRFDIPDSAVSLKKIGQLEKIEYTSDKLERSGDDKGDFSLYTHKYKTPLHLYADRENRPRVFGAKLNAKKIVTSRGLIG
jgi:hypothetical protein